MSQKKVNLPSITTTTVTEEWEGKRLDAIAKSAFEVSWGRIRNWIARGKLFVDDVVILDDGFRPPVGATVSLRLEVSRRAKKLFQVTPEHIAFVDLDVMVVRKESGLLTVPFAKDDRDTLVQQLRKYLLRRAKKTGQEKDKGATSLYVVHRLDKATSGIMLFARSVRARVGLQEQFREHSMYRRYIALVHGEVESQTFRSHLLKNRGDGMRGSREHSPVVDVRRHQGGKIAITHVEVLEKLENATLIECRLETGRTNQIRIHLSESGHPLIGEKVYMRGFEGKEIKAPRLMLHAAELGFEHPATLEPMHFEEPLPIEFTKMIEKLRSVSPS